ncbi:hypothetical protein EV201_2629 [Ancylomarina subtilis]|uniref:Uncharacterized protein n=1 Tax=Ancylomarina subtilis TaxID=1639035 RepID=A0A4Q7VEB9_9BACT|nr:hypothetical protein EV201_2629 [Ancylomarina subtilis]
MHFSQTIVVIYTHFSLLIQKFILIFVLRGVEIQISLSDLSYKLSHTTYTKP